MSAILSQEENNTATTDLVENAGKQIVAVTGNCLLYTSDAADE